jgi:tetratricopeptide (TPR) repeat protein
MPLVTDHPTYLEFIKKFEESSEQFALFIGAGLSAPLFPLWPNVLKELVNKCADSRKLRYDREELLDEIDKGNYYLDIANVCATCLGDRDYREFLAERFNKDFKYEEIPPAYRKLLELNFQAIITTNYDRIPEIGTDGIQVYDNTRVEEAFEALRQKRNFVMKIHGDILNQASIVFTYKEYEGVIFDNNRLNDFLKIALFDKTALFMGFGFSDPHLHQVLSYLHTIDRNRIHYALMPCSSDFLPDSLDERYGVKVIPYKKESDTHPEVLEFVTVLGRIKNPDLEEGVDVMSSLSRLGQDLSTEESRNEFIANCLNYVEEHKEPTVEDFNALEAEKNNLLKGIEIAFDGGDYDSVIHMVAVLGRQPNGFFELRGYWNEAIRSYEQGRIAARATGDEESVGIFTMNMGKVLNERGQLDRARDMFQEAAAAFQKSGNQGRLSESYHLLGMVAFTQGKHDEARQLHEESLKVREDSKDFLGVAFSKHELGRLARAQGRFQEARKLLYEALEGWYGLGEKDDRIAPTLHELGMLALEEGDWQRHHDDSDGAKLSYMKARRFLEQSLEMKRALGMQWAVANSLNELGRIARVQNEFDQAHQLFNESLEIKRRLNDEAGIAHTSNALSRLMIDKNNLPEAQRLCNESLDTYRKTSDIGGVAACNYLLGLIAKKEGNKEAAKRLFSESIGLWERLHSPNAVYARQHLDTLEDASV